MAFMRQQGYRVVALAPKDEFSPSLERLADQYVEINLSRRGMNLFGELGSFVDLLRILAKIRPSAVLSYTPKPNIYAGLACRLLSIPFLPNVAGLGAAFGKTSLLSRLSSLGYRWAFRRAHWVFFQNDFDRDFMLRQQLCQPDRSSRLNGSGVDIKFFDQAAPQRTGQFVFLMCSRLIKDKGVDLYVSAARQLMQAHPHCRCVLLGAPDDGNPGSLTASELEEIKAEGCIEHHGFTSDVRPFLRQAHCVVHPSIYREGLPRVLLEAAATGRPVITTDWPGCRDAVEDGKNGFLIEPRSLPHLVEAMVAMASLPTSEHERMCDQARSLAVKKFSEAEIFLQYKRCLDRLPLLDGSPT